MELNQLKYFVQVAKLESVSRAAETLHVSQPALSKAIGKLEAELSAPLFVREGRRMLLNDRGRRYLVSVERVLRDLGEANLTAGNALPHARGSISVGVFGTQSEALECVAKFMQLNPDIFVNFDARQQVVTSQVAREHDLVFFPRTLEFDGIAGVSYATTRLMLCVSEDHPLSQATSVDLAQFKDEPFVFMNTTAGVYEQGYQLCRASGFVPRVRAVTSSGAAQMRFIQEGAGIGLVDTMRVNAFQRRGVRLIELSAPRQEQLQCFACRPVEQLSEAGRAFLDFTLSFFGIEYEYARATFEAN